MTIYANGKIFWRFLYQFFLHIFNWLVRKGGIVFMFATASDFKKWIMYTFMAHPSGWDIKYT